MYLDERLYISTVMESGCLAASSDNFENVLRDLTVSDKGKFKWSGTFENLEIMMNNVLEKQTVWNSSGGDCKKLELDDLCVRWYMKNKSLTINGEGSEDLKSQLRAAVCVAESDAAASQQPNVSEVVESDDDPNVRVYYLVIPLGTLPPKVLPFLHLFLN